MSEKGFAIRGFLLPHPPILVPSVGAGREAQAAATLEGLRAAASRFAAFAPDTVVLISPHAPLYRDYLFVYHKNPLSGSFAHFGAGETGLSFPEDSEFTESLLRNLETRKIPAGPQSHTDASSLDHGALVPLWFLSRAYGDFSLVVLSQSALDEPDILGAGACIAETAAELSRRTCVIASGDMSHRVSPASPYGMKREGAEFDAEVCKALRESMPAAIRDIDPRVREGAGECGYRSIVMLEGAMPKARTELLSYEAPFGIGYCAAEFYGSEEKE